MINNQFKESFLWEKEKKKTINILTAFSISHKSGVKIFLKWIVNHYPKDTGQHDPYIYIIFFFKKENNLFRLF